MMNYVSIAFLLEISLKMFLSLQSIRWASLVLLVTFGKFSSLSNRACSTASGEPYISSRRSHTMDSPVSGFLMLTVLILLTCSADSFPRYLVRRSSSSAEDRSRSVIAFLNDVFQAQ